ncbi:MAG: hypothetical protein DYG99_14740 [Bacteroidetes bacterium CHB5]|nr:hypothetical protein [Bacteroidetes bacterium CHB5]
MELDKVKKIGTIILFVVLVASLLTGLSNEIQLSLNYSYTVGTTIGYRKTSKGTLIDYKISVNNIEYDGTRDMLKYNPNTKGGRYYVKFLPSDPTINRILWDQPVPDHITEAPPDGWSEIPK